MAQSRTQVSASTPSGMRICLTSSGRLQLAKNTASWSVTNTPDNASHSATARCTAPISSALRTLPAKAMHSAVLNMARSSLSR